MNDAGKIIAIQPRFAIPGAEVTIDTEGFEPSGVEIGSVLFGDIRGRITAASSTRILAIVPDEVEGGEVEIRLECDGARSQPFVITIGKELADGMHLVANPAIDPADDSLVLTRSGSRGQHLPATLFRLEKDGFLDEMPDPILNPTGLAFNSEGRLFVTNRAEGEVYEVSRDGVCTVYATGLGVATGIAFDEDDRMYVGDRSGTIFRVGDFAESETFAMVEPSVAAFHMAFGPDGRLYVTAPGLASHDAVHVVDSDGVEQNYFRGLGRPQGLAFDTDGNLYIAACYGGRHGIVRISPDANECVHFVAGNNIVGLCFDRSGNMIVATNETAYSIKCGVQGILLK